MLRNIFATTHAAITVVGRNGRIVFANSSLHRMHGYAAGELDGRPARTIMPALPLGRCFAEPDMFPFLETINRRKDGTWFPVQVIVDRLHQAAGPARAAVIVCEDITGRRQREKDALEIGDKVQRQIAQELHDGLGQLLAGISFMGKALEHKLTSRSLPEAADAAKIHGLIRKAYDNVVALVQEFSPMRIEREGLVAGLQLLCQNTERQYAVSCRLCTNTDDAFLRDNPVAATHLYRIAQIAVAYACKYHGTRAVSIDLKLTGPGLALAIGYDGSSIPEAADRDKEIGLDIIRFRIGILQGTFSKTEQRGGRSVITCTIPARSMLAPAAQP